MRAYLRRLFCRHKFETYDSTCLVLYQKCPKCDARRTIPVQHD